MLTHRNNHVIEMRSPWTPVRHLYPWGCTIERIVQSVKLPNLDGPVVYITSDYGGSNERSLYDTTSVLYLDLKASENWEHLRREVRARYLADGRRMSFKALGDRQRQSAIIPFLDAANQISGITVTIAIRKSIRLLCSDKDFFEYSKAQLDLDPRTTLASFERMLRVVNLLSLLMGGLAKPNQHLYWISDQDAMFSNPTRTNDLKNILDRWASHYVNHPLGEVGLGTTAIDEGDRVEEDLNSIPDLTAGAVAEAATALARQCGGFIPSNLSIPLRTGLSAKSDLIYSWIADGQHPLQKVVIVFENREAKGMSVFRLNCDS